MVAVMEDRVVLRVREERAPTWAMMAPLVYLLACAACVRACVLDRSIDIGIAGLLVAVGLAPAFVMPAIFSTRGTSLGAADEGLLIGGRLVKFNDVRISRAERGMARLHVDTRNGETRTFVVASYKDAQKLMSLLPPVSAPAGVFAT
jgi:hypothetical protein